MEFFFQMTGVKGKNSFDPPKPTEKAYFFCQLMGFFFEQNRQKKIIQAISPWRAALEEFFL